MVFESIIFCVDNSNYMMNGDHPPSRRLSQNEAINKLASAKINQSPENTIGLVFMAGRRSEVAVSHTREVGEIMRALHSMKLKGHCDLLLSLKVAQLVLKNRNDKNQRQRVVMFVGSPVNRDEKDLERIGKFLKKNGVALDLIQLGYENGDNENTPKLQKLVASVNSGDNSHFVNFARKDEDLVKGTLNALIGAVPSSQENIDEIDPELAMALRMSLADQLPKPVEKEPVFNAEKSPIVDPEADELAKAIAMSLDTKPANSATTEKSEREKKIIEKRKIDRQIATEELLKDKDFLEDLIQSLPDIDKQAVDVEKVVKEVFANNEKESDKDEDLEEEKKKKLKREENEGDKK